MPQNKSKRNAYMDGENQLPGVPGYRTRQGRSGYDPLDTNREAAFMEGTFYRNLFTLRLRTRNTFYLILMFIFGTATTVFMSFTLYAFISAPKYGEKGLSYYLILGVVYLVFGFILIVGLALLANFLINLGAILGIGKSKVKSKGHKESNSKRLPKRRKDFR
jgi:hypothetical protein